EHGVAHLRQALPAARDGALKPPIATRVARRDSEYLAGGTGVLLEHRCQLGLASTGHVRLDTRLVAAARRVVEHLPLQRLWQVLLRHPVVTVGVRVGVTRAVAEALRVAVSVAQV